MLTANFWSIELLKMLLLGTIAYTCGQLVRHCGIKVNYTRKINFFALYLVPMFADNLVPTENSAVASAVRAGVLIALMALFTKPVRENFAIAGTMFLSYDRPEDRPYTMFWLTTQLLAGYAVIIPMEGLFASLGYAELIYIPILVHGLGDGLAEPVGIRYGKHCYSTRALWSKRLYTRTLEGSSCVLVAGIIAVLLFQPAFSLPQFLAALVIIPIGMTWAEAVSPHTWDTPLMFLTGTTSLMAIMRWL